jgi:hypothetical protein
VSPRRARGTAGDAPRRAGGTTTSTTRRRHLSLAGQGDLNDRRAQHAACNCIHSAQSVFWLTTRATLADEADAHATGAAHRRTAVCAGAQKRAAAAAALEAQATLPGSSSGAHVKGRGATSYPILYCRCHLICDCARTPARAIPAVGHGRGCARQRADTSGLWTTHGWINYILQRMVPAHRMHWLGVWAGRAALRPHTHNVGALRACGTLCLACTLQLDWQSNLQTVATRHPALSALQYVFWHGFSCDPLALTRAWS